MNMATEQIRGKPVLIIVQKRYFLKNHHNPTIQIFKKSVNFGVYIFFYYFSTHISIFSLLNWNRTLEFMSYFHFPLRRIYP